MNDSLRHMFYYKAPCNLTQHCWLTTPNIVGCYLLRPFAHPVACCCVFLGIVAQSLTPVKVLSQQLPTFLLFRDRRSIAQQCWIRLPQLFQHCWSHAHALHIVCKVVWVAYPSHDAPQVLTLMGVVAAICTPFSSPEPVVSWSRGLDCYKLSRVALGTRMFAHNCQHGRNNSQHCCFST